MHRKCTLKVWRTEMVPRSSESRFIKISVSVTLELLDEFDRVTKEHGYQRSEAIRKGMRMVVDELRKRERYKTLNRRT